MATGWRQIKRERPRLTTKLAVALPPTDRTTILYDPDLVGFGIRVSPASSKNPGGTRTWVLEYRPGHGGRRASKRRISLGRLEVVSADVARAKAQDILADLRINGIDPLEQITKARTAPTVDGLRERYFAATNPHRKESTRRLYDGLWRVHISPRVGSLTLDQLTKIKIADLHLQIGKQHPATANRAVVLLSHFLEWCREFDYLELTSNPARTIKKFKLEGRRRYLSRDEFVRLGRAIAKAEESGIEWQPNPQRKVKHAPRPENRRIMLCPFAAAALRLLIFTGARLREILHLEWSHVDLDRGLLWLPDSKTGAKTIVLGAPAIEVLQSLSKIRSEAKGARFVIEGVDPAKPRADLQRPWKQVRDEAKLVDFRLHDLRHSFASVGAASNLGLPVIGALLGHSDPATTARYAHLAVEPLRAATDGISMQIKEMMDA